MYRNHVPAISEYALRSPDRLASVITFALLSIRQPFGTLQNACNSVAQSGELSPYLWGWKRDGYNYAHGCAGDLLARLEHQRDVVEAIDTLCEVPGLGIVKASFVAQMLGHEVACFDSRNLAILELPVRAFREFRPNESEASRKRKIAAYVQMTVDTGGAEHWWDHWCTGIAPSLGATPYEISARHLRYPQIIARLNGVQQLDKEAA